jgi:hypothetical protein
VKIRHKEVRREKKRERRNNFRFVGQKIKPDFPESAREKIPDLPSGQRFEAELTSPVAVNAGIPFSRSRRPGRDHKEYLQLTLDSGH